MRKLLIVSHGKFASGLKNSLEMFVGMDHFIKVIDAYLDKEHDPSIEILEFIDSVTEDDEAVIFTDLLGGSVNQQVSRILLSVKKDIYLISNCNMPIVLSIVLHYGDLSEEVIDELITSSNVEHIKLNEKVEEIDEDDFFA